MVVLDSICNTSLVSLNVSTNCGSVVITQLTDSTYMFVLPAIVLFGFSGNIISLVTIYTTKLRLIPANQYLIVLTVSDSVFLLTLVFTLLKLDYLHVYVCMAVEYLLATASYTSSWTITALTIERFLAIFYPLSRLNYGDMDRTRRMISSMLPLPWFLNLVMLGYLTEQHERPIESHDVRQCVPRSGAWQISIEVTDLVLCYVMPCCIVVVLNILVAKRLRTVARQQVFFIDGQHNFRRVSTSQSNNCANGNGATRRLPAAERTNYSRGGFSRILIVVPIAYLLLNTPFYMVKIASLLSTYGFNHILFDISDGSTHELVILFYNGAHYMYYLNFASDFIVYAFASSHFRQAAMTSWRRIVAPIWQRSRGSIMGRAIEQPSRAMEQLPVRRTSETNFVV